MILQQIACSNDSSIFAAVMSLVVVFSWISGMYLSTYLYNEFNRRLIIYVEAQNIETLDKAPVDAFPVYSKGKLIMYVREEKEL